MAKTQPWIVPVAVAVIYDGLKVLMCQRLHSDPEDIRDRWEFPGGKVDPGEQPKEALRREILEELNLPRLGPLDTLGNMRIKDLIHARITRYSTESALILFYLCLSPDRIEDLDITLDPNSAQTFGAFTLTEIGKMDCLPGVYEVVDKLRGNPCPRSQ